MNDWHSASHDPGGAAAGLQPLSSSGELPLHVCHACSPPGQEGVWELAAAGGIVNNLVLTLTHQGQEDAGAPGIPFSLL